MPRHPQLIAFEVIAAIGKQAEAIEELTKKIPASEMALLVEATGELVKAWRDYQQALDPEGWEAAVKEMEEEGALVDLPFLKGGSKT